MWFWISCCNSYSTISKSIRPVSNTSGGSQRCHEPRNTPICDSWDKINNSVDSNLQLLKFKLEARAGSKRISHVETPRRATSPSPSCLKLCNSRVIVFTGPPPKMFKYWKHSLTVWLSRPDKSGRAQLSGHLGKITQIFAWIFATNPLVFRIQYSTWIFTKISPNEELVTLG